MRAGVQTGTQVELGVQRHHTPQRAAHVDAGDVAVRVARRAHGVGAEEVKLVGHAVHAQVGLDELEAGGAAWGVVERAAQVVIDLDRRCRGAVAGARHQVERVHDAGPGARARCECVAIGVVHRCRCVQAQRVHPGRGIGRVQAEQFRRGVADRPGAQRVSVHARAVGRRGLDQERRGHRIGKGRRRLRRQARQHGERGHHER